MWLSNILIGYIARVVCGSSSLQFSLSLPTFSKDDLEFGCFLIPHYILTVYSMVTLGKFRCRPLMKNIV